MLVIPLLVQADTLTLVTGTPGDDLLATPTGPSPNFGDVLLTFSTLTDGTTYTTADPLVQDGVTISSPDGLTVEPYSTQSNPNFLFDDSSDGSADITISLANGVGAIAVGIADSDSPANIELQVLGAGGVDLGSPFAVTIPETTVNPGNGYFAVEDTNPNIYGLRITETDSGPDYSGLAIADVQVTPEPSSLPFLAGGIMAIFGFYRLRKKA
jgi:hypothetical protein